MADLCMAAPDAGMPPWQTQCTREVSRMTDEALSLHGEALIEEVPVALVFNGVSHAVMLATPTDLEDFALGFSLCEGIVTTPREVYACEIAHCPDGIEVHLEISSERFAQLKERRRNLAGRTGCGLCGVESLRAAVRRPASVTLRPQVTLEAIARALGNLPEHQVLHRATGAAHAAAWASTDGEVVAVCEDVGRHNALDKLVGRLVRNGIAPSSGFVAVTSRASYEMVQKVAAFGAGMLVAVSAPTAFAVRLADELGVSLAGFARAGRLSVYTHRDSIVIA